MVSFTEYITKTGELYPIDPFTAGVSLQILILIIIGLIILKGLALWKSARLGEKGWFWVLVVLNTIILDVIYLYLRRGRKV